MRRTAAALLPLAATRRRLSLRRASCWDGVARIPYGRCDPPGVTVGRDLCVDVCMWRCVAPPPNPHQRQTAHTTSPSPNPLPSGVRPLALVWLCLPRLIWIRPPSSNQPHIGPLAPQPAPRLRAGDCADRGGSGRVLIIVSVRLYSCHSSMILGVCMARVHNWVQHAQTDFVHHALRAPPRYDPTHPHTHRCCGTAAAVRAGRWTCRIVHSSFTGWWLLYPSDG